MRRTSSALRLHNHKVSKSLQRFEYEAVLVTTAQRPHAPLRTFLVYPKREAAVNRKAPPSGLWEQVVSSFAVIPVIQGLIPVIALIGRHHRNQLFKHWNRSK